MPLIHGEFQPNLVARPIVPVPEPLTIDEAYEALRKAAAAKQHTREADLG